MSRNTVAVAAVVLCGSSSLGQQYSITDIAEYGNEGGRFGLTNNGFASGSTTVGAFKWNNGVLTTLSTVESHAQGINSSGNSAGFQRASGLFFTAVWWQDTTLIQIGAFAGGRESFAWDINDSNLIVGQAERSVSAGVFTTRGFSYSNGAKTELPTLPGEQTSCFAYGVNNGGVIVGSAGDGLGHRVSTRWTNGLIQALPTLGGYTDSEAVDITDSGLVLTNNTINLSTDGRATLWNGTSLQDIGHLGGGKTRAFGINGLGHVVGRSLGSDNNLHGFVWTPGSGMLNLDSIVLPGSGYMTFMPQAINDQGWILGSGRLDNNGAFRVMLLKPVPEPATILALATGLVGATLRRRRNRPRTASSS